MSEFHDIGPNPRRIEVIPAVPVPTRRPAPTPAKPRQPEKVPA